MKTFVLALLLLSSSAIASTELQGLTCAGSGHYDLFEVVSAEQANLRYNPVVQNSRGVHVTTHVLICESGDTEILASCYEPSFFNDEPIVTLVRKRDPLAHSWATGNVVVEVTKSGMVIDQLDCSAWN